jgi:hypothetical protein
MKHRHIAPALLLAFTFVALPVFAETTEGVRVDVRKELEQKKAEIKTLRDAQKKEIEQKRAEIKDQREENKGERKEVRAEFSSRVLSNKIRSEVKVFTATANRLDKIVARIEARIVQIKAAGGVTTDIETNLNVGKTKLAEARTHISEFSLIDLSSATSSTTARTLLGTIKEHASKAKEALKASHSALIKAVSLMQGVEKKVKVRDDEDVRASTTKPTSN